MFPTYTPDEAESRQYISITRPYNLKLPHEAEWFIRAITDLREANCCLVEYTNGVEIWRHRSSVRL
jgi:hypothetical protein